MSATPAVSPRLSPPQIRTSQIPQQSNAGGIPQPATGQWRSRHCRVGGVALFSVIGRICWVALLAASPALRRSFRQPDHQYRDHRTNCALADGRFLAEVKNDKGQRTVWVRNTATNTETQILGAFAT